MNKSKDSNVIPGQSTGDGGSVTMNVGRGPTRRRLKLDQDKFQHHAIVTAERGQETMIHNRTVSPVGRSNTCLTFPACVVHSTINAESKEHNEKDNAIAAKVTYVKVDLNETCCSVRDIRYKQIHEMSKKLLRSCEYMLFDVAVIADPFLTLFGGIHDQHMMHCY